MFSFLSLILIIIITSCITLRNYFLKIMKKSILILLCLTSIFTMAQNSNSLLQPWSGAHNGVPNFTVYTISDFKVALDTAIQQKLNETETIANNKKPANFYNTIAALEKSGKLLARVLTVYDIYSSNMNSPEFALVETEFDPKLAALSDKIVQNKNLFNRIKTVFNAKQKTKLTTEQQRLVWVYYDSYIRQGAKLDANTKAAVAQINQKLATNYTKFSQNLLAEENNQYVALLNESDFDGLSAELKNAAIAKAKDRKLNALGCIDNTR